MLMEAAPAGVDVDGMGARDLRARRGCARSTTSTSGPSPPASARSPPTSSSPSGADRDLIRRRLELTLRERFGIEHTTLQMEEEASQELLHVENAPARDSRVSSSRDSST